MLTSLLFGVMLDILTSRDAASPFLEIFIHFGKHIAHLSVRLVLATTPAKHFLSKVELTPRVLDQVAISFIPGSPEGESDVGSHGGGDAMSDRYGENLRGDTNDFRINFNSFLMQG